MSAKSSIFDLSWNKDGFFAKLSLVIKSERCAKNFLAEKKSAWGEWELRNKKVEALSRLSSTYYSVAGSSFTQVKKVFSSEEKIGTVKCAVIMFFKPLVIPFWLLLGTYCFIRMLSTSNKMLRIASGYKNLTANQCDVRQSVLRAWRRWDEALVCVHYALDKKTTTHTTALLYVGEAKIYQHFGEVENVKSAVAQVLEIVEKIQDIWQAIRVYRHCADLSDWLEEGSGQKFREKAKQLALKVGAKDQLLKV